MTKPYIVYSLSKERTTQKFRKSKITEILLDIERFLNKCTSTNIQNLNHFQLTIHENNHEPIGFRSYILGMAEDTWGASENRLSLFITQAAYLIPVINMSGDYLALNFRKHYNF